VYFGEVSLSGAVRPVAQSAARLKEAHKLGFARAYLPEPARGEASVEAALTLTGLGGLADLVADIAQRGKRRGAPELSALSGGADTPPGKRAHS
jgi:DNA repair protein RadA/Sms